MMNKILIIIMITFALTSCGKSKKIDKLNKNNFKLQKGENLKNTLLNAAIRGNIDLVKILIEDGISLEVKSNYQLKTPLIFASEYGKIKMVKYLILKGANLSAKDKWGDSSLHIASEKGHLNVVKTLLNNKAQINLQNNYGVTPLMLAVFKDHYKIVEYLIKHNADIKLKAKDNDSAITWVKSIKTLEILLKNKANINHQGALGNTRLFRAAYDNDIKMIKYLYTNGANLNLKNNFGDTALIYLCSNDKTPSKDTIHFILDKGGNLNSRNKLGFTALGIAKHKGHTDIVELLSKRGGKE